MFVETSTYVRRTIALGDAQDRSLELIYGLLPRHARTSTIETDC